MKRLSSPNEMIWLKQHKSIRIPKCNLPQNIIAYDVVDVYALKKTKDKNPFFNEDSYIFVFEDGKLEEVSIADINDFIIPCGVNIE